MPTSMESMWNPCEKSSQHKEDTKHNKGNPKFWIAFTMF